MFIIKNLEFFCNFVSDAIVSLVSILIDASYMGF